MRIVTFLTFALLVMTFVVPRAFSQDLPCVDSSQAQTRLDAVTALLDGVPELKEKNDPELKTRLKQIYVELVKLSLEWPTSAEIHYQMARYYHLKSNSWSMMKHLKDALFFDPAHVDALIMKGDIYTERFRDNIRAGFEDSYKRAQMAYNDALKVDALSKENEAAIYVRLGDLNDIYDLPAKKAEAREYWNRAVNAAPASQAAAIALGRLASATVAATPETGIKAQ